MKRSIRVTALAVLYSVFGIAWLVFLVMLRQFFLTTLLPYFERTPTGYSWRLGALVPLVWIVLALVSAYGFWKARKWAVAPGVVVAVTYPSVNIVLVCLGVQTEPMGIIIPVAIASVLLALTAFSWNQLE